MKIIKIALSSFLLMFFCLSLQAAGLTPEELFKLESVSSFVLSPDCSKIAFTLRKERELVDESGSAYNLLYLLDLKSKEVLPLVTGKQNVNRIKWTPDGRFITFLSRRNSDRNQLWLLNIKGGEAVPVSAITGNITDYCFNAQGSLLAFVAPEEETRRERELKKMGFNFIFFEENLKSQNVFLAKLDKDYRAVSVEKLPVELSVRELAFSADGKKIFFTAIGKNLVDYDYMFKDLYLFDLEKRNYEKIIDHDGKFDAFEVSPSGRQLLYTASYNINDHSASQLYYFNLDQKKTQNITPADIRGHAVRAKWVNERECLLLMAEGVWNNLYLLNVNSGKRKLLFRGSDRNIILTDFACLKNPERFIFAGNAFNQPQTLYLFDQKTVNLLFDLNPELKKFAFAPQKVFRYKTRDGLEIEGILVYPLNFEQNKLYPLVVSVHGGPEAHNSNGWLNSYFLPAQILAARGYFVFLPNYRASTGYGVDFAMQGFSDAAGKEFDDIADGINALVQQGLVDKELVGVAGGSYGGFAAAWFATYYTALTKAAVVFVGITDLISKRLTTDIPFEEVLVHSGKPIEEMWEQNLRRSPIFWAHQSKTATLIVGGRDDPRVHPSQGLELYRIMKLNNHPAVRLIYYPGEGHGNQRQHSRWDLLLRHLQWLDYYLLEKKSVHDALPPLDISSAYGVKITE